MNNISEKINFSFSDSLRKDIEEIISLKLTSLGIMFRIFSRNKDTTSLNYKLRDSKYGATHKIQDAIGVRIALYFNDDIEIVHHILNTLFSEREKDHSIDIKPTAEFSAVRYNIVYDIPDNLLSKEHSYNKHSHLIDYTFELQIRSILSEGWHEVEHDLRYKSKSDWSNHDYESRKLNGIYATLETSEWTMIKIFDELAYKHYKSKNWEPMLRQKFRLRMQTVDLNKDIEKYFDNNINVAKEFYRLLRNTVINDMAVNNFSLPINVNTLIYFCNKFYIKDSAISSMTPPIYLDEFE
ncbi:RelA/SpoT protein [Raoultella ornithinolytica]|uniref:RelA/SpoT protein n=1 Tax=Pseudomonas tritici TaxID=2745518 RepID=A0A8H9YVF3_9PSED|nr:RelA/SpoT protein [Raoultella ornithinolytica]MDH7612114.1 RelA/SpoT protein [Raoultella ornithinolytica]